YEVLEGFLRGVVVAAEVKQQGGDGGACKVFSWLLRNVMEVLEVLERWDFSWSSISVMEGLEFHFRM
nr:hypothetical protein [Tanacetum cinerariifolium]